MRNITVNKNALLAFAAAFLVSGCAVLASEEAVVFCQTADTVTTLHAIDLGAREANPVVKWLLEEFGPKGFIAAKAAATVLFLQVHPEVPSGLVQVLNGVTCAVAARNALIASKLERKPPPQP